MFPQQLRARFGSVRGLRRAAATAAAFPTFAASMSHSGGTVMGSHAT